MPTGPKPKPLAERIAQNIDKNGPIPINRPDLGPCWLWNGTIDRNGYGQMGIGSLTDASRRTVRAHRISYEVARGPIPGDLCLDHLCRVHRCVNPAHLEPVTNRENLLRGEGFVAIAARKTHCPQGHPYSGNNLYVPRSGGRQCKACWQLRRAQRRAA